MTDRPRVFVARRIPDDGLDLIRDACAMELWDDELPPPREDLLRAVAGCDGILTLLTDKVDDELLDAAGPQLKVVSDLAVGYDNVDVPACTLRGIAVGNTPGVLTETTADLAFGLLMAGARRIAEGDRLVRAGGWKTWGPLAFLGTDVHGSTLGIVGFGRIGQAVARRAAGFGMPVLHATGSGSPRKSSPPTGERRSVAPRPPQALGLREHPRAAGTLDATPHRRARVRRMKPTAMLINTARGPSSTRPPCIRRCATASSAERRSTSRTPSRCRRRPAPDARQLPGRAPHRLGFPGDPRQDGGDGRREPHRGRPR